MLSMSLLNAIKANKLTYLTIFVILTLLGVLFSYQYLFKIYFASDEWVYWAFYLKDGPFYILTKEGGLIGALTGKYRVGLYLTNDIYFYLFGLDIKPWIVTFLALHLANIFLLYKVLRKLKLTPLSSFLASLFFGVAFAGQEGLSWPAAGIPVLGATLFTLIVVLITLKYNETKKMTLLILAAVCCYICFLFRPTGLVSPALVVSLIYLYSKNKGWLKLPRSVIIIGVSAFFLGLARTLILYSGNLTVLLRAAFDIIFYPFVTLTHIFIPFRLMLRVSKGFIDFYYPLLSKDKSIDVITQLIVSDFIASIVSLFIIFLIYLLYKRVNKLNKKVLIFGLITFFIQYIPIAINYPDRGGFSYLDSRHTYISIVGISMILGVFFDYLISHFNTKKQWKRLFIIILFIFVGLWFFRVMTITRREVRAVAFDDTAIKKTWDSLQSLKLPNSKKMVFYIESDRTYFYPEWKLPFKLPATYMFPLAFYGRPFIDKHALGVLQTDNNYIDINNTQYGYFTNIKALSSLVKSNKIDINNVVGLHFADGSYTFKNITPTVRKKIEEGIN